MNPAVFFLILLKTIIIKKLGKTEPTNDNNSAAAGVNALLPQNAVFIASGIAILLSSIGHIATKSTASHTQFSKLLVKKLTTKSI